MRIKSLKLRGTLLTLLLTGTAVPAYAQEAPRAPAAEPLLAQAAPQNAEEDEEDPGEEEAERTGQEEGDLRQHQAHRDEVEGPDHDHREHRGGGPGRTRSGHAGI